MQTDPDSDVAGQSEAFQYTAAASGTTRSASVYLDASSTAASVIVGVYTDASGRPGQLLGTATVSSPVAGAWNAAALSVNVTAGTTYWVAVLQPAGAAGAIAFRDGGSGLSWGSASSTMTALPSTYAAGSGWLSGQMSVYLSS